MSLTSNKAPDKTGVLVVNLGTPKSPYPKDVKTYLGEFLMDPMVIDIPYLARWLLIKGIILNTRPKKSAEAYQAIWTAEGSPLLTHSKNFTKKLKQSLNNTPVALAMNYGTPSLEMGLKLLKAQEVNKVLVFQLYPQRALSTTESVKRRLEIVRSKSFPDMEIEYLPEFYDDETYLNSLAASIESSVSLSEIDHMIFSFHGIPESHIIKEFPSCRDCFEIECRENRQRKNSCYRSQCYATADEAARRIQLPKSKYSVTFQSRFGPTKWIEPYTDKHIDTLIEKGVKRLAVACPAFASDCLETLEEIGIQLKEDFISKGGTSFQLIPCLNDNTQWVNAASQILREKL